MEEARIRIYDLINRFIRYDLLPDEQQELEDWLNEAEHNRRLFDEITSQENITIGLKAMDEAHQDAEKIENMVLQACTQDATSVSARLTWLKIAGIAASVLLIGSLLYYFLVNQPKPTNQTVTVNKTNQQQNTTGIQPGTYKATLTLADGRKIVLDSANNGPIAQQGNTTINNKNGTLIYSGFANTPGKAAVLYNTLTTAKGETYPIVLPDGTKIWLNSVSAIRYPATFNEAERKVEITGEAYFEVAKDVSKPFKVSIIPALGTTQRSAEVEVLGTHFNVNAYDDEPNIKTTLLEGSVKVIAGIGHVRIKPGQQAIIPSPVTTGKQSQAAIKVNTTVNADQAIAWKNGDFDFNNTDLKAVMRQLSRWYNIEVVYPNEMPVENFWGKISRNTKIADVLYILNKQGYMKFYIEGRKIIIKP